MITTASRIDTDTRDYLTAVALRKGRGAPGIFVPGGTNIWPVLGCLIGGLLVMIVLGLMLTLPKSAWAVAMLVTAGLWLGGWLMAYPIRRWLGSRLGTFTYFDPHTVYEVKADEITVTDIREMNGLAVTHNTSNNAYSASTLKFKLPGKALTVTLKNQKLSDKVDEYYQALGEIEAHPNWSGQGPTEQGAAAVLTIRDYEIPRDVKLLEMDVFMPDGDPAPQPAPGIFLRVLVLIGIAVAIFFGVQTLLVPQQDHEAFANAKAVGVHGYRDYLLDDRNTRHREEAKAKIKELYQEKIAKVRAQATKPEHRDALVTLLENLSECEGIPLVSIQVKQSGMPNPVPEAQQVRTALADAFGTYLGRDYIEFVECPEGADAHFYLEYSVAREQPGWNWALAIRPILTSPVATTQGGSVPNGGSLSDLITKAIFQELLGMAPPVFQNIPIGGGDFDE